MPITKEKLDELNKRMDELGISKDDLIEKFILGSGPGGQKVQKSHSCVYLKHIPTGLEVKCQRDRSRVINRYLARRDLCEKIANKLLGEKRKRDEKADKIRRQKKRRSRRLQQKLIANKRQLSEKKTLRKPPSSHEDEN
ncbi:MAG: Peptide chain release factor 2 [Chlamydiae bacterium]|nr:Peptide chain release factor 2 [Chlamydiota bacterium]